MMELQNVTLRLNGVELLSLSLVVSPGEVVTVMGPSGAGKSALLGYLSGTISPVFEASGQVKLNGRVLNDLPPEQRRVGLLFQDDLLFPHLTVAENLAFGMPRGSRAERLGKIETALAEAGLEGLGERPPHTLSGGQRARVALMRALLAGPQAMLLDEPFNKLDAERRAAMRDFVFDHIRLRGIPCLMVTHDRADAPADGRVLMLKEGHVTDA
jgi:putative thiamine transport system ATP-binding protein